MPQAIKTSGVSFGYGAEPVVHRIDFTVESGDFVGIIGPNGSGKSTLIKIISGYLRPGEGEVFIEGQPLSRMSRRRTARYLSVVPQEVNFFFPYKVMDFIMLGRHPYHGAISFENEQDRAIAISAMEDTDTLRFRDRSVLELSFGEKQRVLLAAALAQDTGIILLDEPTSALDIRYQIEINSILANLNESRGITIVSVTHDLNLAALFCRRLVLLSEGRIGADGTPEQIVTPEMMKKFYGVEVIAGQNQSTGSPYVLPTGRNK